MFGSSNFSRGSLGGMLILTSLFVITMFGTANAETSVFFWETYAFEEGPVEMPIQIYNDDSQFQFDEFHFLIRYDTSFLTFEEALPGNLLEDNSWENFTYEVQAGGIISISASTGNGNPLGIASGDSLAVLHFWMSEPDSATCRPSYVEFYWQNCMDNSFINTNSNTIFIEDSVRFWAGYYNFIREDTLPTRTGMPESCLPQLNDYDAAIRKIAFEDAPIMYPCRGCSYVGDLDCDGYSMQPGDYLLYGLYFFYGLSVFTVNIAAQVGNSDINMDGRILTVTDWSIMYPLMVGHVYLDKNGAKDPMVFIQDTYDKKVYCRSQDTALYVHLYFDKICDITEFNENITALPLRPEDRSLVPLVAYNFEVYSGITDGWLFSYTGDPILQEDTWGNIEFMESAGCGDANHDKSINVSDAVFIINYVFAGLPDPYIRYLGDANCDGSVNVSDAVYLINHIFISGPYPCDSDSDGVPDC